MNNDYIIITGYKFKSNNDYMFDILKNLFGSNQAICGLDSNGVIHITNEEDCYLKPKEQVIDFYAYIDSLDFIDEDIKKYLKKFYDDLDYEKLFMDDVFKLKIKLRDFYIKLKGFENEFEVNVELIIYDNNLSNFIFNIKIPNNINYINFQHSLLYESLEYIQLPNQYLDYSNVDTIPEENEIVRMTTPHYFYSFIDDFFNIIKNNNEPYVKEQRSSVFINRKRISKQNIYKLLYQSNIDIKEKEELKDYRLANDYCHYSDQILSILIGKQVSYQIRWIILLDTLIINSLLIDNAHLNNIYDNSYSLKELLQVQEEYERNTSFKNYFPLVEGNDYINSVFKMLNKYDVNHAISIAIERKKEEKQNKKELLLSIIGCILAVPSLYSYIFEPMIVWIYNLKNKENLLTNIPGPYNFIIGVILLIILLIIICTLSYLIDNKKNKKTTNK